MTTLPVSSSGVETARDAFADSSTRSIPRVAATVIAVAAGTVLMPNLVGNFHLYTYTLALTYLIAVLGLNLLLGFGGVTSLGTAAFMMLGAYAVGVGQHSWDLPFWVGALIAMVVCAAAGLVTVIPVLRLGKFAVAVVTLSYLTVIASLIDIYPDVTGGGEGLAVERAAVAPATLWYVFAAIAFVVYVAVTNLMRSPFGRSLNLSRLSPLLSQSLGSFPSRLTVVAFAFSASLAGLAGALYPVLNGRVSTANFTIWQSVLLVLMVVVGGEGTVMGPLLGVALLTTIPVVLNTIFEEGGTREQLVYGLILLLTVLVIPQGLAGSLSSLAAWARRRVGRSRSPEVAAVSLVDKRADQVPPPVLTSAASSESLEVRGLAKHIGGITAVDGVDLTVRPGTIHGLIGPNGSGKTTLLNCINGFYTADAGSVRVSGTEVPKHPSRRARVGIGRTFQQPVLLDQLSALDNVWVGVDRNRTARWWAYLLRLPSSSRETRRAIAEAKQWIDFVGLRADYSTPAALLGPGKSRLIEVARALARRPTILLMDEPAAGLTAAEMEQLEVVIRAIRSAGITVLLVDHHADLVLRVCDEITVIASGAVIASGTPDVVRRDAKVINTYLGRRFVEIETATETGGDTELEHA